MTPSKPDSGHIHIPLEGGGHITGSPDMTTQTIDAIHKMVELAKKMPMDPKPETPEIEIPAEIMQQIKIDAERKYPFVWPLNKHGEEIVQRVGQGAPGSAKAKKIQNIYIQGRIDQYRHLMADRPGLRWVKGKKPPDGIDGQILHIKPILGAKHIIGFKIKYVAIIYMGKHDGGLDWHWYDGPQSAWHTKISPEMWENMEWLDETSDHTTASLQAQIEEMRLQLEKYKQFDKEQYAWEWIQKLNAQKIEMMELKKERDIYRKALEETEMHISHHRYGMVGLRIDKALSLYPSTPKQ